MLSAADFPEGFRVALSLRGFRTGRGRQPLSPKQQAELGALRQRLQRLLIEEGFVEGPAAEPTEEGKPSEVERIVQQVLDRLQRRGLVP